MNYSVPRPRPSPSNFAAPANRHVTTAKGRHPIFHQGSCALATSRPVVDPDGDYAGAVRSKKRKNPKDRRESIENHGVLVVRVWRSSAPLSPSRGAELE